MQNSDSVTDLPLISLRMLVSASLVALNSRFQVISTRHEEIMPEGFLSPVKANKGAGATHLPTTTNYTP